MYGQTWLGETNWYLLPYCREPDNLTEHRGRPSIMFRTGRRQERAEARDIPEGKGWPSPERQTQKERLSRLMLRLW